MISDILVTVAGALIGAALGHMLGKWIFNRITKGGGK